jgi:hypothetical protein
MSVKCRRPEALPKRRSGKPGPIPPAKSLAPYRDCLGREGTGTLRRPGRGSFDRGDLKEAAGGAGRAMEPLACFWFFDAGYVGGYVRRDAGKAALELPEKVGARWRRP